MNIDLSKQKGALVPLYFFRRPLEWPEQGKEECKIQNEKVWQK